MPDDFIKRYVGHGLEGEALPVSPMDPPKPYEAPAQEKVSYNELAAPLKILWDEHERFLKVVSAFDRALVEMKAKHWKMTQEISSALKGFFQCVDESIAPHEKMEEKALFPLLREKLLTAGESSPTDRPVTPVDVMEDEHVKIGQSVAIVFTLLGLAPRLRDEPSRDYLFEQAYGLGQEICELLKLHIYRENTILFPRAQQLLSDADFSRISDAMEKA